MALRNHQGILIAIRGTQGCTPDLPRGTEELDEITSLVKVFGREVSHLILGQAIHRKNGFPAADGGDPCNHAYVACTPEGPIMEDPIAIHE